MRQKWRLTCNMEEDDARIFSYFVGRQASVERMSLSFLNLQRAHDFLRKCIHFINNSMCILVINCNNHFKTDSILSTEGIRCNPEEYFTSWAWSVSIISRSTGWWVLLLISLQPVHFVSWASDITGPDLLDKNTQKYETFLKLSQSTKHYQLMVKVGAVLQ